MATGTRSLLAILMLLGLLFAGDVGAQSCGPGTSCDVGEAWADCQGKLAGADAKCKRSHPLVMASNTQCVKWAGSTDTVGFFDARTTCVYGPEAGAAAGSVYSNQSLGASYYSRSCASRAPMLNMYYRGEGASCSGGCEFAPELGAGVSNVIVKVGNGTGAVTRVGRMAPTGGTCTVGDGFVAVEAQTTDQCQQQGALTQCLTPDGRTCAVASSGKKFCWEPSEAGIKVSGNEAASKVPAGMEVKAPPKQPTNGGDWQQGGTGTVSVTNGGTTNNYNTTNFNSSYGSQGGGANGGGADGEGNGGSGEGEGEGNGSASGGGTCSQPYVCSGDPIMCSLGQQMWLSRCGDRKGDENGDGIPDALMGDAPENPDPGEDVSPTRWGINVGTDMLDIENIFGAGSCPVMPSFTIMGQTISPSEFPQWCTLVSVMRAVVLVMGAFTALCILMGWI